MFNKIIIRPYILKTLILIFSTFTSIVIFAQDTSYTRPPLIDSWKTYLELCRLDSTKKMVELKSLMPAIVYDLRYAGSDNFMHRRMYPPGTRTTFLRAPVANGLLNVQRELNQKGIGLKIFDAYRPYSVTVDFWELVKDERYVAHPGKGSGHNRGIAVDLTLINLLTGEEMDMGTGFDNFTDTAHSSYIKLPADVLENRALLRNTMEKHGFKVLETEWWHFYWSEGSHFEILDLSFKELKKKVQ
jgi:zinc D-Ala-D-Ala dipeptidase